MLLLALQFVLGLAILAAGAEVFIRAAVEIARRFGVSPFLIGLTLVGFGTSAPELVVNLSAAFNNSPDLAIGNVVGSNIANIGLILGAAALVRPLNAQSRLLKVECPLMILVGLLLWDLAADGTIDRLDAALLLAVFAVFLILMFRTAKREPEVVKEELAEAAPEVRPAVKRWPTWCIAIVLVLGLAGLVGGAELMVESAVSVAEGLGVSKLVIGLTIVAVGTSLPELAASLAAARKGESEIAIGNVVGSNIFNVVLVLATTAFIVPLPVSREIIVSQFPVMCGFSLLLVPILLNGLKVHRWEGGLLLCAYAGFIGWQVYRATQAG